MTGARWIETAPTPPLILRCQGRKATVRSSTSNYLTQQIRKSSILEGITFSPKSPTNHLLHPSGRTRQAELNHDTNGVCRNRKCSEKKAAHASQSRMCGTMRVRTQKTRHIHIPAEDLRELAQLELQENSRVRQRHLAKGYIRTLEKPLCRAILLIKKKDGKLDQYRLSTPMNEWDNPHRLPTTLLHNSYRVR